MAPLVFAQAGIASQSPPVVLHSVLVQEAQPYCYQQTMLSQTAVSLRNQERRASARRATESASATAFTGTRSVISHTEAESPLLARFPTSRGLV